MLIYNEMQNRCDASSNEASALILIKSRRSFVNIVHLILSFHPALLEMHIAGSILRHDIRDGFGLVAKFALLVA